MGLETQLRQHTGRLCRKPFGWANEEGKEIEAIRRESAERMKYKANDCFGGPEEYVGIVCLFCLYLGA